MSDTNSIILITGSTSGIGRHAALELARAGYRVIASGRNPAKLADLASEAHGLPLETLVLDVTDAHSITKAATEIAERTGGYGVDVLINNAGFGDLGPLELVSDSDLRAQYETNVFGLMAVTRAFVGAMRERGSGKIINVSSVGGKITLPMFGAYNSTKYAVESLSDALRMELAPFGVHVSLLEPGVIRTNFTERSVAATEKYRGVDSPYSGAFARMDKTVLLSDKMAVGPEKTTRAIFRAVRSRRPRARYMTPLSGRLTVAFLRLLPTRWSDAILRSVSGLTRKNLRPVGNSAQVARPTMADRAA